jgi:hypothetical protein
LRELTVQLFYILLLLLLLLFYNKCFSKEQWAKTVLLPNVTKLTAEKSYLYRITALDCLAVLFLFIY